MEKTEQLVNRVDYRDAGQSFFGTTSVSFGSHAAMGRGDVNVQVSISYHSRE